MIRLTATHWCSAALVAGIALTIGCVQKGSPTSPTGTNNTPDYGEVYKEVVKLTDDTEDPAEWGKNYPYHYADFMRTEEMVATKYGGSHKLSHTTGTATDSRAFVAQSKIDEDDGLKKMWAGMPFSIDFREDRGHAYMLIDQIHTKRQNGKQPGACLSCHASTYVTYKKNGDGDITKGWEKLNPMSYPAALNNATHPAKHPVSCIDCHDPVTTKLRITRPAFMEGIKAYKASQGIADYDVNQMATKQEMKSYTCGQCHVEYYFKGNEKRLTFPWSKGLKVENIYAVYEENGFKDWQQPKTGSNLLKAQHPEFETWSQGIHARSNVSCADCHMGKKQVKGVEITDHYLASPMLKAAQTCLTCHPKWTEAELKSRVETIQDRTFGLRNQAMGALKELLVDIETASASAGGTVSAEVLALHRKGQFYFDFVEAENSVGFHAPDEANRILGESINYLRQAQVKLFKP